MNSDPSSKRMITNNSSTSLAEALGYREKEILSYLYLGRAKWENLMKTIRAQEQAQSADFNNEQVWTFLIGCGYALCGEAGIRKLASILTGSDQVKPLLNKMWFEFLPLPPRQGEGNTSIDLALGTISCRKQTRGGIKLDDSEHTWVCFCEMKYNSDISCDTTHDSQRNQLLRVIENALCFQKSGRYADKVFVTLVTPDAFRYANVKSRLYQYKYEEYKNDPTRIIGDLQECSLLHRMQTNWHYPTDMVKRINNFSLNWITYEELLANSSYPEETLHSGILLKLRRFWENYGRP